MLDHVEPRRKSQTDLQTVGREARYLDMLPPHQRLRLTRAGTLKKFAGGSLILSEGSEIEEVYLILRGMVTVGLCSEMNPSLSLYLSGPGTVVDMCALLNPPVSPASIHALTDVEALAIPRAVFVQVMKEETAVACEVLQHLCTRLSLISRVALKEVSQEFPGPSLN